MAVIRPLRPEDAAELAELYRRNREFLAPYDPVRPEDFFTEEGQRRRIELGEQETAAGLGYAFAILDGDGALAGRIALSNVIRGIMQTATAGYFVSRDRNGRGLATSAVKEVVEFAFLDAELHRVEAGTLVDNVASQRVLEKNGFERIGVARRYLQIAGDWRDHVLFQRIAD